MTWTLKKSVLVFVYLVQVVFIAILQGSIAPFSAKEDVFIYTSLLLNSLLLIYMNLSVLKRQRIKFNLFSILLCLIFFGIYIDVYIMVAGKHHYIFVFLLLLNLITSWIFFLKEDLLEQRQ